MKSLSMFLAGLLLIGCFVVNAYASTPIHPKKDSAEKSLFKPQQSISHGIVTIEGKKINYKAIAGTIILKNRDNKPTCSMFYVAYIKEGGKNESQRPVTFLYNGGPGSSSIWLHMAGFGPKRVYLNGTKRVMPPYKMVNNNYSLLDASDLVFIDMPSTGFSRILTKSLGGAGSTKHFFSVDGDAHAFAQFIKRYLSKYGRWNSPKYLYGESYGTYRSAVVSNILETEDNIDLNGVILQSMLLNFNKGQMAGAHPGDVLSYVLSLPSEAAAAWVHHKLPIQPRPAKLAPFLKKVEHFATTKYATALIQGSLIDQTTYHQIAEKLHKFTGLSIAYLKKANLRVGVNMFEKELLSKEGKITGAYDATFTSPEMNPLKEYSMFEPTTATVSSPLISVFNNYIRKDLKFGKGMKYRVSNGAAFAQFDFRTAYKYGPSWHRKFYVNALPDLAGAMIYNPKMKVMLNMGYYDLVTPFYAAYYEMHHLPMPKSLQKNISYFYYKSGHMVYLHDYALKALHDNVAKFIESSH